MHPHSNIYQTVAWTCGSIASGGLFASLAAWGWTPQTIIAGLGAATAFIMAIVTLLREVRVQLDRVEATAKAVRERFEQIQKELKEEAMANAHD